MRQTDISLEALSSRLFGSQSVYPSIFIALSITRKARKNHVTCNNTPIKSSLIDSKLIEI